MKYYAVAEIDITDPSWAQNFYESEEYRPYRERRIAGARNEFALVAGEDVTGLARIAG